MYTTLLHIKKLNETESPIFVLLCVLCFQKGNLLDFLFTCTSLQLMLVQCVAVKRLPVLQYIADYIFVPFGIIGPILVNLKIEYRLSRC